MGQLFLHLLFLHLNTLLAATEVDSPKRLDLHLNDVQLAVVILGFITPISNSSLLNCHRLPEVSE